MATGSDVAKRQIYLPEEALFLGIGLGQKPEGLYPVLHFTMMGLVLVPLIIYLPRRVASL